MTMPTRSLALALPLAFLVSCGSSKAPPIEHDHALTKITEHVYVIHGPNENPSPGNQGFANNPGFVLVRNGVVVIDPGSSVQVGEMVLRQIATVTRDPVIAVFNTHLHGDHWLGNQAIKAAFPKAVIYAHPKMIDAVKSGDGEHWVEIMNAATQGASRGTKAIAPDLGVDNGDALKLHGMTFRIYHNDRAHTDNDIMIEVVEEGTIFLGDNVLNQRIASNFPEQGNIQGQIAAIDLALQSKATHFIPGHGLSGGREIAVAQQVFLKALQASVKRYYDQGLGDFEMTNRVMNDLAAYRAYYGFNDLGRVISAAYLQVEAQSF
jgi:glyoxylase-like metal-dependent hydrolase (beta-lactamase superfamily II)